MNVKDPLILQYCFELLQKKRPSGVDSIFYSDVDEILNKIVNEVAKNDSKDARALPLVLQSLSTFWRQFLLEDALKLIDKKGNYLVLKCFDRLFASSSTNLSCGSSILCDRAFVVLRQIIASIEVLFSNSTIQKSDIDISNTIVSLRALHSFLLNAVVPFPHRFQRNEYEIMTSIHQQCIFKESKMMSKIVGATLPLIVQSLLRFSQIGHNTSESEFIILSQRCLFYLLQQFSSSIYWRKMFPGTFSSIFTLAMKTQSTFPRASKILCLMCANLIFLCHIVMNDEDASVVLSGSHDDDPLAFSSNRDLVSFLQSTESSTTWDQFLKTTEVAEKDDNKSHSNALNPNEKNSNDHNCELSKFNQWRVDVLQRISDPFIACVMRSLIQCKPHQVGLLCQFFTKFLLCCQRFLGKRFFHQCVYVLLANWSTNDKICFQTVDECWNLLSGATHVSPPSYLHPTSLYQLLRSTLIDLLNSIQYLLVHSFAISDSSTDFDIRLSLYKISGLIDDEKGLFLFSLCRLAGLASKDCLSMYFHMLVSCVSLLGHDQLSITILNNQTRFCRQILNIIMLCQEEPWTWIASESPLNEVISSSTTLRKQNVEVEGRLGGLKWSSISTMLLTSGSLASLKIGDLSGPSFALSKEENQSITKLLRIFLAYLGKSNEMLLTCVELCFHCLSDRQKMISKGRSAQSTSSSIPSTTSHLNDKDNPISSIVDNYRVQDTKDNLIRLQKLCCRLSATLLALKFCFVGINYHFDKRTIINVFPMAQNDLFSIKGRITSDACNGDQKFPVISTICCGYCKVVLTKQMRCSKCKSIYYCSLEHQKKDWPRHKNECKLMASPTTSFAVESLESIPLFTSPPTCCPCHLHDPLQILDFQEILISPWSFASTNSVPQSCQRINIPHLHCKLMEIFQVYFQSVVEDQQSFSLFHKGFECWEIYIISIVLDVLFAWSITLNNSENIEAVDKGQRNYCEGDWQQSPKLGKSTTVASSSIFLSFWRSHIFSLLWVTSPSALSSSKTLVSELGHTLLQKICLLWSHQGSSTLGILGEWIQHQHHLNKLSSCEKSSLTGTACASNAKTAMNATMTSHLSTMDDLLSTVLPLFMSQFTENILDPLTPFLGGRKIVNSNNRKDISLSISLSLSWQPGNMIDACYSILLLVLQLSGKMILSDSHNVLMSLQQRFPSSSILYHLFDRHYHAVQGNVQAIFRQFLQEIVENLDQLSTSNRLTLAQISSIIRIVQLMIEQCFQQEESPFLDTSKPTKIDAIAYSLCSLHDFYHQLLHAKEEPMDTPTSKLPVTLSPSLVATYQQYQHYEERDNLFDPDEEEEQPDSNSSSTSTSDSFSGNQTSRKKKIAGKEELKSQTEFNHKFLVEILLKCRTLLSLPNLRSQHQIVDLIGVILNRLQSQRKSLLPALHQIWQALIDRFTECHTNLVACLTSSLPNRSLKTSSISSKSKITRDSSLLTLEKSSSSSLSRIVTEDLSSSSNSNSHSSNSGIQEAQSQLLFNHGQQINSRMDQRLSMLSLQARNDPSSSLFSTHSSSSFHSSINNHGKDENSISLSHYQLLLISFCNIFPSIIRFAPSFMNTKVKDHVIPLMISLLQTYSLVFQSSDLPSLMGLKNNNSSFHSLEQKTQEAILSFLLDLIAFPVVVQGLKKELVVIMMLLLPFWGLELSIKGRALLEQLFALLAQHLPGPFTVLSRCMHESQNKSCLLVWVNHPLLLKYEYSMPSFSSLAHFSYCFQHQRLTQEFQTWIRDNAAWINSWNYEKEVEDSVWISQLLHRNQF